MSGACPAVGCANSLFIANPATVTDSNNCYTRINGNTGNTGVVAAVNGALGEALAGHTA